MLKTKENTSEDNEVDKIMVAEFMFVSVRCGHYINLFVSTQN
jgi:hypothetical protein